MSIWFVNKIYLFFILVCCVQSYLLPFSCRLRLHFSLPLIKITARQQLDKGRGSKSTNHHTYTGLCLTVVFSKRSGLGLLHLLLAANWRTCNSLFGFELENSPALDSQKKREKNKILGSTCGKCSFSKNSNRINIRLWNRG